MKIKSNIIILFVCLMGFSSGIMAQDFIIKGVIIEKGSNIRVALTEITNQRTKLGTGSNDLGMFQLKVKIGDTLYVSKRNLIDKQIVVKDNQDLIVYLIRNSTQLQDVIISGNTKKEDLDEIRRDFKRQGSFYEGKPPLALLNPFGGSPLTFFYELFGKTPAKARRFRKYYNSELKMMNIDQFFNKTIIAKYTQLKGKDLEKFMLDYYPTSKMVENWNNYDAANYIKVSAQKFTDTLRK